LPAPADAAGIDLLKQPGAIVFETGVLTTNMIVVVPGGNLSCPTI
jgi:hypothetical protein